MAVLRSNEFVAIQFPADTAVTVDPAGAAMLVTIPALHSFLSTLNVDFTGVVMIMKHAHGSKGNTLSGFVCDEIRTL